MGVTYFKRYRMELDLRGRDLSRQALPPSFRYLPWESASPEQHAQTKFLSFHQEIDATVFPCLNDYAGCLRLMNEIVRKPGFCPEATWLLVQESLRRDLQTHLPQVKTGSRGAIHDQNYTLCGTVQGVMDQHRFGAIQNLGIVPLFRGHGLGTCLLFRALEGFRTAGLTKVYLEVTSQNERAFLLYKRLGFAKIRTVYKVVEAAYS